MPDLNDFRLRPDMYGVNHIGRVVDKHILRARDIAQRADAAPVGHRHGNQQFL